jgi:hypothetical protein
MADATGQDEGRAVRSQGRGPMPTERRDRKRFRRVRDTLLERLFEVAKDERRLRAEHLSREFLEAVDALEDLEAADQEGRQKPT